jgi:hypothetical protein
MKKPPEGGPEDQPPRLSGGALSSVTKASSERSKILAMYLNLWDPDFQAAAYDPRDGLTVFCFCNLSGDEWQSRAPSD